MANAIDKISIVSLAPSPEFVRKERTISGFARITQFLTWPILFSIFHLLFSIHIQGRENFNKIKSPFIIVSNHINFYDSFFFRLALGLFTPHLPLRFMAVKKFDSKYLNFLSHIGVINFLYLLFGVFTIVEGRGIARNLKEARGIIRARGNVVMYPEGKMVYEDTIGPFKIGAAILAKQTGAPIIPVSFRIERNKFIRRRLYVNIGEPARVSADADNRKITEQFRSMVSDLHNRR